MATPTFPRQLQHLLLFLLTFAAMGWYYGYSSIFHYTPRSTHQWRQTDSASIAKNYYQNGLHFFEPTMHHMLGNEGQVAAGGESTLLCYFAALLYKLLGPQEGWFRLLNWAVFLGGLYALSRCLWQICNDLFYALAIPAFWFSSPVIAYYAFNFVPNIPALGLTIVAGAALYAYYQSGRKRHFYLTMLLFGLAGLMKISALLAFIAIGGLFIIERLGWQRFGKKGQLLFRQKWRLLSGLLLPLLLVLAWKLWADQYNALHQTSYFAARIKPIWSLDPGLRNYIFGRVWSSWSWSYFHPLSHVLIILASLWVLLRPRFQHRLLYWLAWLLLVGVIAYGLLWYKKFNDHDYYSIDLFVYPITIITASLVYIKNHWPMWLKTPWLKITFSLFLLFNIHHARQVVASRYATDSPYMRHFNPSFYKTQALQSFLAEHGIRYPERVISVPDSSPNNTLYHLNLKGWTELYMGGAISPNKLRQFIEKEANYLIVNDIKYLEKENLKEFLNHPIGVFDHSIYLFDLRNLPLH